MNTYIINLNDTIAMSDSAVVELVKVINTCQPCVKEVEANCNDVAIVGIVCLTIAIVALIATVGFLHWKKMTIKASENERDFQKEKEKEECNRKQEADNRNRANMLEDEKRKRDNAKEDKEIERKYALEDEERKPK